MPCAPGSVFVFKPKKGLLSFYEKTYISDIAQYVAIKNKKIYTIVDHFHDVAGVLFYVLLTSHGLVYVRDDTVRKYGCIAGTRDLNVSPT